MQILHFHNGQPPRALDALPASDDSGLVWVDYLRPDAAGWASAIGSWLKVEIDPQHIEDSLNPQHPPFFDGTPAYDMLVFPGLGLGPEDGPFPIEIRTAAFFLFDRVLVSVRAPDNVNFDAVRARLLNGRAKPPRSALELAHLILDAMVDRFLGIREPLDAHFNRLQDELLDPDNGMNDWRALLQCRREVRKLEALCEGQLEAIDAFRRSTRKVWSNPLSVRFRDLSGHIGRVLSHASNQERDIEAAVQLHFAATSERTNRIIQTLTVISAVFFPLTLITGIYGMNFHHMPELAWRYGYFGVLALLSGLGCGLLVYFRKRGYF